MADTPTAAEVDEASRAALETFRLAAMRTLAEAAGLFEAAHRICALTVSGIYQGEDAARMVSHARRCGRLALDAIAAIDSLPGGESVPPTVPGHRDEPAPDPIGSRTKSCCAFFGMNSWTETQFRRVRSVNSGSVMVLRRVLWFPAAIFTGG